MNFIFELDIYQDISVVVIRQSLVVIATSKYLPFVMYCKEGWCFYQIRKQAVYKHVTHF